MTLENKKTCSSQSSCPSSGANGSGCSSCAHKTQDQASANQDTAITNALANVKNVVFVMSGKGGVGKSSVTVNVAVALAKKGLNVGILDVDLHGPSIPGLLGLTGGVDMDDASEKLIPAKYMENIRVLSIDSLLQDRDTAILWRGPKKTAAIRQFISEVDWGNLDFLVIDSPPGTGDEHMTILKAIPDVYCLMVTTPQEVSLADVRKAFNFLGQTNARVLGIVENMSGLSCPNCGHDIPLFSRGGGEALSKKYTIPFLGAIPIDPVTVVAAETGTPVVLLDVESKAKEGFMYVAEKIIDVIQKKEAKPLSLSE